MNVSKNFHIKEYVPKETYDKWGNKSIWFMDQRIFPLVQALRDEFGPITINGGGYNYSGYRPPSCKIGAKESQHRFGRGVDLKFKECSVQDVYKKINEYPTLWMNEGLTTLENINKTPTWLHIDIRFTNLDKILIVNP